MSERQILVRSARSFLRQLLLSLSAALLFGGLQAASAELITKPTPADSSLHLIGRYFVGATRTVEVAGDLVYFGSGFYLIEANVSDPAHPVIRTRKRFASHVRTLSVVDNLVYVAQDRDTLHVVAGGRRALIEQGKAHLQGLAEEIVMRDKFAYVAAGPSGLLIFDVSAADRPRQVGHFPIYTDSDSRLPMASGVDVLGKLVFLVTSLGLHIIDVSDPARPDEVYFISDVAAYDVHVEGNYAFVAGREFRVYSLLDPAAPVELGTVDLGSYTHGMDVQDNFAYVASSTGLIVLDVSDPVNPHPVAHYATTDIAFDVSLSGTHAYVATEDGELHILDVSDPRLPVKVGRIVVDDAIEEVRVSDGVAYAAAGRSGLLLLDISDPAPLPPRGLATSDILPQSATLTWRPATDDTTPTAALSYSLRVGTAPGASDVVSPGSITEGPLTGVRSLPNPGNVGQSVQFTLTRLEPERTYYWSVQAVDHGYAASPFAADQSFTIPPRPLDVLEPPPTGIAEGGMLWGDYDRDGDLDLLLTGHAGTQWAVPVPATRLYRNDEGTFSRVETPFEDVSESAGAWGDFDGDGDLDLVLTGRALAGDPVTHLYRNDRRRFRGDHDDVAFSRLDAGLEGLAGGTASWGDFDGDGDLDLLVSGKNVEYNRAVRLYRNEIRSPHSDDGETQKNGGAYFIEVDPGVRGGAYRILEWADFDADGDLDIFAIGGGRSTVFRNDDSLFTPVATGIPDYSESEVAAAWGDYDNDGDLDLAVTGGHTGARRSTRIYRNDEGIFVDIQAGLPETWSGAVDWGDFDGDGELDPILASVQFYPYDQVSTRIYSNEQGIFTRQLLDLPGVYVSSAAWGDLNADGNLDLAISGYGDGLGYPPPPVTYILLNQSDRSNRAPDSPTRLAASYVGARSATLTWFPSEDDTTPQRALTYNIRVGTAPGGDEITAGMAFSRGPQAGRRLVVGRGNTGTQTRYGLEHLEPGRTYYWSVQAVDHSFAGSPFAEEMRFTTRDSAGDEILLGQNYPNPFSDATTIYFSLPEPAYVRLEILDVLGRAVTMLADGPLPAGNHEFVWNTSGLASGPYLYRLVADASVQVGRLLVVRTE